MLSLSWQLPKSHVHICSEWSAFNFNSLIFQRNLFGITITHGDKNIDIRNKVTDCTLGSMLEFKAYILSLVLHASVHVRDDKI